VSEKRLPAGSAGNHPFYTRTNSNRFLDIFNTFF